MHKAPKTADCDLISDWFACLLCAAYKAMKTTDCDLISDWLTYLLLCAADEAPKTAGCDTFDYLVKWAGLPYSECTHEDSELIRRRYPESVEEYERRQKNTCSPNKNCKVAYILFQLASTSMFRS